MIRMRLKNVNEGLMSWKKGVSRRTGQGSEERKQTSLQWDKEYERDWWNRLQRIEQRGRERLRRATEIKREIVNNKLYDL